MLVPTKKVKLLTDTGPDVVTINASDFNPKLHEEIVESEAAPEPTGGAQQQDSGSGDPQVSGADDQGDSKSGKKKNR